jgi:NAD(P)-dependent dehydrogenase (short-subunit alcohol dehydrogenase family)
LTIHNSSENPNYKIYDAYSCSKTALNAFTVMLANEFKDTNLPVGRQGFKINSVSPGYTATDLNHFKGTQTVEQGAKTIVQYATLNHDGPTGKFFYQEKGEIPW